MVIFHGYVSHTQRVDWGFPIATFDCHAGIFQAFPRVRIINPPRNPSAMGRITGIQMWVRNPCAPCFAGILSQNLVIFSCAKMCQVISIHISIIDLLWVCPTIYPHQVAIFYCSYTHELTVTWPGALWAGNKPQRLTQQWSGNPVFESWGISLWILEPIFGITSHLLL